MTPLFLGLAGPVLTPDERAFFAEVVPAGYILFRRNCIDRPQMRALTDDLRALAGRPDLPILIDQEGGRVARMAPPEWPAFPKAEAFDRLYDVAPMSAIEAARANAQAIAVMLAEVGVTVDCLPLLDVRDPAGHDIIGDRAFGAEPMRVSALGRATIEGLREGGVVGVVKHIPGHGRAQADSHVELPVVTADAAALERDLEPFIRLAGAPMAMTAHVVYSAWDAAECASLSATVIGEIIRGRIGFDGLLMSRRSWDAGAFRRVRRAGAGRARRRLRHRAALLGRHGGNDRGGGGGGGDRRGGGRAARSRDGGGGGAAIGGGVRRIGGEARCAAGLWLTLPLRP